MAAGLGLLMRSESFAVRAGRALQLALVTACRVARRPASFDIPGSLLGFRDRAGARIAARGWRLTAATAASNLTLWLVLLACLRGIGLSQAQVPWQTSLAAFAFVRLLTVLPITPGGLGITELGLIATLAAGAGHRDGAQVTAAVLLYRAVTYLPPIPLGAIACLTWRHAPGLIHAKPADAGQPADMIPPGPGLAQRMGPGEAAMQRDGSAGDGRRPSCGQTRRPEGAEGRTGQSRKPHMGLSDGEAMTAWRAALQVRLSGRALSWGRWLWPCGRARTTPRIRYAGERSRNPVAGQPEPAGPRPAVRRAAPHRAGLPGAAALRSQRQGVAGGSGFAGCRLGGLFLA